MRWMVMALVMLVLAGCDGTPAERRVCDALCASYGGGSIRDLSDVVARHGFCMCEGDGVVDAPSGEGDCLALCAPAAVRRYFPPDRDERKVVCECSRGIRFYPEDRAWRALDNPFVQIDATELAQTLTAFSTPTWPTSTPGTSWAPESTPTPTETPTPGTSWIQCSPRTLSREAWATWAAQPGTSTPTATPTDLPIPDNPAVVVSTNPAIQVMINAMPTRRPTIPAGTYPVCVTVDAHGHQDYEPCATPTPTDAAIPESYLVMPNADSQLLCDGERCRWLLRPTPKVEFHPACVAVDQFGDDVGVVACPTATPDPDVMFCPGGTCQAVQP